jgi:hypothetical protein
MFFRSARIMTRISSSVLLWKYAIPVAVLAHCAWLIASPLLNGAPIGGHIVIPRLLLALSAVLVFKIFAFDLADSVDDGGDHLAGLACGPGAPVCVTIGAFVGGAAAAFGVDLFWKN